VLPKKFSSDPKFIERFYKEGRAAAKLNDQNIVQAYDVGQAGEHHYFVMEYVDGDTVYDRIVAKKRFSEKEAIQVVRQVASALKHAHEQGFIHRDIKPKNIMLKRSSGR
jgi:serine/threonine protein kinase